MSKVFAIMALFVLNCTPAFAGETANTNCDGAISILVSDAKQLADAERTLQEDKSPSSKNNSLKTAQDEMLVQTFTGLLDQAKEVVKAVCRSGS